MTQLFAWLMAALGPLVIRAVVALGFTAVTYAGVTTLVSQLVTMAQNNWAAMPTAVLQLAALSGIPQVMGMIFGAYMARIAMWAAVGASRYVLKT